MHSLYIVAGWSSLVARRAHNPKVVGSNPAPAISKILIYIKVFFFVSGEFCFAGFFLFYKNLYFHAIKKQGPTLFY